MITNYSGFSEHRNEKSELKLNAGWYSFRKTRNHDSLGGQRTRKFVEASVNSFFVIYAFSHLALSMTRGNSHSWRRSENWKLVVQLKRKEKEEVSIARPRNKAHETCYERDVPQGRKKEGKDRKVGIATLSLTSPPSRVSQRPQNEDS